MRRSSLKISRNNNEQNPFRVKSKEADEQKQSILKRSKSFLESLYDITSRNDRIDKQSVEQGVVGLTKESLGHHCCTYVKMVLGPYEGDLVKKQEDEVGWLIDLRNIKYLSINALKVQLVEHLKGLPGSLVRQREIMHFAYSISQLDCFQEFPQDTWITIETDQDLKFALEHSAHLWLSLYC